MKRIVVDGKVAFLFLLVVIVLFFSVSIVANDGIKQKLHYFVDNNLDSVDSDNDGRIDFAETTGELSSYHINGLSSCSGGVMRGLNSADNNNPLCQSFDSLWGSINSSCQLYTKTFPSMGSNRNGYLPCPSGKVMVRKRAVNGESTGKILCC